MTMVGQIEETYSVYPGEYKPLRFDIREVREELNMSREGASEPVCNVIECTDHYKIEIIAPGHTKDDFIVTIDKGQMNVFAVRRQSRIKEQHLYRSHEFNYDCFEHTVLLPGNIDTDFIRAEYKDGILCVCFPKTDKPVKHAFHQIVIY